MSRAVGVTVALLIIAQASHVAIAQTAQAPRTEESSPAPPPKPATEAHSGYWLVGGLGFAAARAGCPDCEREGVFSNGRSVLVDVGLRMNPRLDFGVEVVWGETKLEDDANDPTRTTFVMGVAQVRPWQTRGFFFKAGMGAGIIGNLQGPFGGELEGTHTTNTLGLVYGAGWVFQREKRFAMQVHGSHHIAALGELQIKDGPSIKNVLNNYWSVMVSLIFR